MTSSGLDDTSAFDFSCAAATDLSRHRRPRRSSEPGDGKNFTKLCTRSYATRHREAGKIEMTQFENGFTQAIRGL